VSVCSCWNTACVVASSNYREHSPSCVILSIHTLTRCLCVSLLKSLTIHKYNVYNDVHHHHHHHATSNSPARSSASITHCFKGLHVQSASRHDVSNACSLMHVEYHLLYWCKQSDHNGRLNTSRAMTSSSSRSRAIMRARVCVCVCVKLTLISCLKVSVNIVKRLNFSGSSRVCGRTLFVRRLNDSGLLTIRASAHGKCSPDLRSGEFCCGGLQVDVKTTANCISAQF